MDEAQRDRHMAVAGHAKDGLHSYRQPRNPGAGRQERNSIRAIRGRDREADTISCRTIGNHKVFKVGDRVNGETTPGEWRVK